MASPSEDLQKAIYDFLAGDADVDALIDGRIYDGVPDEESFPNVSFGASSFVDDRSTCISGFVETLQIDVWCRDQSRLRQCKALTWLIMSKLRDANLSLATHALAGMDVNLSQVYPDPDGITAHGVVQVTAMIEEG